MDPSRNGRLYAWNIVFYWWNVAKFNDFFIFGSRIPLLVTLLAGIFAMIFCNGIHIGWRLIRRIVMEQRLKDVTSLNNLVYGSGMAGNLVANKHRRQPQFGKKIIGFIDDDIEKTGTYIGKTPVFGTRDVLETVIEKYHIDELIVAMAQIEDSILKSVTLRAKKLNVTVKAMPGLFELIDGKFNVRMIRDVEIEDLLTRESIKLDYEGISDYLENQVVMVTGGGGSIGSELCRQIAKFQPKQLIVVDIYENNAYDLQNELLRQYSNLNLVTLIASVRDRDRLERIY